MFDTEAAVANLLEGGGVGDFIWEREKEEREREMEAREMDF